jgi:hypothetical protein
MIGFGPSYVGHSGKLGIYISKDLLLISNYERQYFLADAFDAGIGVRKYYGNNKHKLFIQPNISYCTYQPWNWNTPPLPIGENRVIKTPKISGVGGVELSLGKRFNVNLELGYGYYSNLQFGRVISRASLNYVIYKKSKL